MDCDSERIWKIVESQRHSVPKKKRAPGTALSLFDRLYDCYVECTQRQNDKNFDKRFRNTVNLLHQLSPDHAQPSLIVNLYSDDRGYSIILNPGDQGKEIFLQYEDNEIFSYLDNQEIPPVLMEVLCGTSHCHMYGGCMVCEVRNYRHFSSSSSSSQRSFDSHLVMLRPTTESILQMVNELATETSCSLEDQLLLESKLLLATQPPICLDPSTEVVWVTNRLHYNRRKFHSPSMRRYLRRRSQARRARMHHTSLRPAPSELRLHDFLTNTGTPLKCPRPQFSDVWRNRPPDLTLSSTSVSATAKRVQELAKVLTEPPPTPATPSPTISHTPSAITPPVHVRAQGQRLAEEFLESGGRAPPTPIPSLSQVPLPGISTVTSPLPPPHTSPAHKAPPTILSHPPQPPTLRTPPLTHSLTISLPHSLYNASRSKAPHILPSSQPTSSTSQPTPPHILPPSQPQPTITIPTSVMEKIRHIKRPHPIVPTRPIPPHLTVALTAGKTAATVAPSNQRPLTTTQMAGRIPAALMNPPKLQRPPTSLPPLSPSIQHTLTSMPKLHRFATPNLPTPPLSLQPQAPPSSSPLPTGTTSTRATPPMPVLRRLATANGTSSSTSTAPSSVAKTTPPLLKAGQLVVKLKKLQWHQQNSKP